VSKKDDDNTVLSKRQNRRGTVSEKTKISDLRKAAADNELNWKFSDAWKEVFLQVNDGAIHAFPVEELVDDWRKLCSAIEEMTELQEHNKRLQQEKLYVVDALFHAGDVKLGDDAAERYGRAVRVIVKQRDDMRKAYEFFKERGDVLEQEVCKHSGSLNDMAQAYNKLRKGCLKLAEDLANARNEAGSTVTAGFEGPRPLTFEDILDEYMLDYIIDKKEDPKNETEKN